jgi:hypothetical protein
MTQIMMTAVCYVTSRAGLHKLSGCLIFVSECTANNLQNETLEEFGNFKIGGQVVHRVKYADDLGLLATEEMGLQGTTGRLTERYQDK